MTPKDLLESARRIFLALICFFGVIALGASGWFILFENGPRLPAADAVDPTVRDFEFGLDSKLFEARNGRSFVFSPLSLRVGLMMARTAAREQTRTQINRVLYPLTLDAAPEILALKEKSVLELADGFEGFKTANRLWLQRDVDPSAAILADFQKTYKVMPGLANFQGASEDARVRINTWFNERLGPVGPILVPGTIDTLTRFILTSGAVYEPAWDTPFDPRRTEVGAFRLSSGETVDMPFMRADGAFPFAETSDLRAILLPCGGATTGVMLIVPRSERGFWRFLASFDSRKAAALFGQLKKQNVEVTIPRFQVSRTIAIPLALSNLGMNDSFEPGRADFSGFAGHHDLFLNTVIHKSLVTFSERPSRFELQAQRDREMGFLDSGSRTRIFRANQPFIFLIRDLKTNTILLMGHLADPRE